ncbi:7 transmembrane sweet-taste receptor of 3 GCPR-domain-containing protein [Endogone sp. FLAS-F59071]|nr:7 transmembrane sweet-taste receptor of 3 GCPR-domain-containing protein [Endogone sp. FLAS-F59071]|eukprot:RUS19818.1 7 transmembrane sweet-taste receptor of 3 GCPR-domain-containing protein [Endogone sp. FLAS-F59071]
MVSVEEPRTRSTMAASFWLLVFIAVVLVPRVIAIPSNTSALSTSTNNTVINIGILLPDPATILPTNVNSAEVVGGIAAIKLAVDTINNQSLVSGATFNLIFGNTSDMDMASTIFTTSDLLSKNPIAIIGDASENQTYFSAVMSSKMMIPQCSFTKDVTQFFKIVDIPYFFRMVPTDNQLCEVILEFIIIGNWTGIVIVYDDTASEYFQLNAVQPQQEVPGQPPPPPGLQFVVVLLGPENFQVTSLQILQTAGLIKSHIVIGIGNIAQSLNNTVGELVHLYDGLIMVDTAWNLSGLPQYDEFLAQYSTLPNSTFVGATGPTDLSHNQPYAYSCMMMIARGVDQVLDRYPTGRSGGLADLASNSSIFLKTANMTPTTFNTNYTGPAGYMQLNSNVANPTFFTASGQVIVSIAGFWMVCCLIVMIVVICKRNVREIRASSPLFACVELLGLILIYSSTILNVAATTKTTCILRPSTLILGYIFVMGGLIAKNFRVYRVFRNKYALQTAVKDSQLLRMVTSILFVALVPYCVWMISDPPTPFLENIDSNNVLEICQSNITVPALDMSPFLLTLSVYFIMLEVWAMYLAYMTRHVAKQWSDSRNIGYVTYNLMFCTVVGVPIYFVREVDPVTIQYLYNALLLFASTFILFALFAAKIAHLVIPPKKQGRKKAEEAGDVSRAKFIEIIQSSESTLQAYEGELTVRIERKILPDLTPWKMKKVVVIPSKKFLLLIEPSTRKHDSYFYTSCEPKRTNDKSEHVFRVSGQDWHNDVLFQVKDGHELERWCSWFSGNPSHITTSENSPIIQEMPQTPAVVLREGKLNNGTFGDGFAVDGLAATTNSNRTRFIGGSGSRVNVGASSITGGEAGLSGSGTMSRSPFSFGVAPRREEQELEPVQETFSMGDGGESRGESQGELRNSSNHFSWSMS